jgi:hypothetical protein
MTVREAPTTSRIDRATLVVGMAAGIKDLWQSNTRGVCASVD